MSEQLQETPKTIEDIPTDLKSLSDVEQVFNTFQSSLNEFIKGIRDFTGSKRQLEDVIINLMVAPLNKDDFQWAYKEQGELFELGTNVNSTKFFMMLAGMEKDKKIAFIEPKEEIKND